MKAICPAAALAAAGVGSAQPAQCPALASSGRIIRTGAVGQAAHIAAVGVDHINLLVTVALRGEGNQAAIRRPAGDQSLLYDWSGGGTAAIGIHDINILVIILFLCKGNPGAVGRPGERPDHIGRFTQAVASLPSAFMMLMVVFPSRLEMKRSGGRPATRQAQVPEVVVVKRRTLLPSVFAT